MVWSTHLEPDILECEVKWALGSITTNKASWGDGIPVELFQIQKDDSVCVALICQLFGKLGSGHRTGKGQFSFQSLRKAINAKECSNYHTIALISHASKVMVKFSKPGFSNMWTVNFQMFKLDLEKAEEPENQIADVRWIVEKPREFQKNICFIDYAKAFDCVDHKKL